jgi:methylenetetrahydrofolate dehydrogenase (NADP+) / methenyltetrahydrofolate cyclohydrolase
MSGALVIDGRKLAEQIHTETAGRVAALQARGIQPGLVFVRVGEDPASRVYVGMKEKVSRRLGIRSETRVLAQATSEGELLGLIDALNADPGVHGILVQAPLPSAIRTGAVYHRIEPAKDVDGFHPVNMGRLLLGDPGGFVPCTPAGVHELLFRSGVPIAGADVVILGRGNIVGKPMAALLIQKHRNANATVTVCHSRSRDLAAHCRRADILIAALGAAEFVQAPMVKPGAAVIDVGVNRIQDPSAEGGSRLVGDVHFETVRQVAGWITPNPGGVGPMTIAMLMRNTVQAAETLLT